MVVHLFKVLADENRLRIINLLRHNELCVCEIEAILGTTQSNISRHLTRLRDAQVVTFEKRAQWIFYQIHPDFSKDHRSLYTYLLESMDQNSDYTNDLEVLAEYRASGLSCADITLFQPKSSKE